MEALEAIAKRTSVRAYTSEPVTEEELDKILAAGMAAPVASNGYKGLHISVIQEAAMLDDVTAAVNALVEKILGRKVDKSFGAPVMIIVSSTQSKVPGIENANAATVLENMAIAATALGLGSIVWGGAAGAIAQDPALAARAGIPEGFTPVLALSLGHATQEQEPRKHEISVSYA